MMTLKATNHFRLGQMKKEEERRGLKVKPKLVAITDMGLTLKPEISETFESIMRFKGIQLEET